MKPINRGLANEFHEWHRSRDDVPVMTPDVDAWALALTPYGTPDYRPRALMELKRSYIEPERWNMFAADRPSYACLYSLARMAEIPFWVLYFQKGVAVEDDTPIAFFEVSEIVPEYHGVRWNITAREWQTRFLLPLVQPPTYSLEDAILAFGKPEITIEEWDRAYG